MSVADNRISAVHETGRRMLRTRAHLAAWAVARGERPDFDCRLSSDQVDRIADAALDAAISLLEGWEALGVVGSTEEALRAAERRWRPWRWSWRRWPWSPRVR